MCAHNFLCCVVTSIAPNHQQHGGLSVLASVRSGSSVPLWGTTSLISHQSRFWPAPLLRVDLCASLCTSATQRLFSRLWNLWKSVDSDTDCAQRVQLSLFWAAVLHTWAAVASRKCVVATPNRFFSCCVEMLQSLEGCVVAHRTATP